MANVVAEVSPGELIDKITILEIKAARIADPAKLPAVRYALGRLAATRDAALPAGRELDRLTGELKAVNEALWEIEDAIRDCERAADFGPRFIELARSVYRTNDRRAALKRDLDELFGSAMTEVKSYKPY